MLRVLLPSCPVTSLFSVHLLFAGPMHVMLCAASCRAVSSCVSSPHVVSSRLMSPGVASSLRVSCQFARRGVTLLAVRSRFACHVTADVPSCRVSRRVVSPGVISCVVSCHAAQCVVCAGVISRLVSSFSAECDVVLDVIYIYISWLHARRSPGPILQRGYRIRVPAVCLVVKEHIETHASSE